MNFVSPMHTKYKGYASVGLNRHKIHAFYVSPHKGPFPWTDHCLEWCKVFGIPCPCRRLEVNPLSITRPASQQLLLPWQHPPSNDRTFVRNDLIYVPSNIPYPFDRWDKNHSWSQHVVSLPTACHPYRQRTCDMEQEGVQVAIAELRYINVNYIHVPQLCYNYLDSYALTTHDISLLTQIGRPSKFCDSMHSIIPCRK